MILHSHDDIYHHHAIAAGLHAPHVPGAARPGALHRQHRAMVSLYVLVQSLENITAVARYFLPREHDCYQFPWGGCAGGANMFVSRGACLATCRVSSPPPRVLYCTVLYYTVL